MTQDDVRFMLSRHEAGGQSLQRRCFIASSFRNRERVASAVSLLRARGLFVYDFTVAQFSVSEHDWAGISYQAARDHPEIAGAARSDITMLRCLGAADFVLVILPCGFSAGWEAGFAASRGAHVVVCAEGARQVDVPLVHADAICGSLDEAIEYIVGDT